MIVYKKNSWGILSILSITLLTGCADDSQLDYDLLSSNGNNVQCSTVTTYSGVDETLIDSLRASLKFEDGFFEDLKAESLTAKGDVTLMPYVGDDSSMAAQFNGNGHLSLNSQFVNTYLNSYDDFSASVYAKSDIINADHPILSGNLNDSGLGIRFISSSTYSTTTNAVRVSMKIGGAIYIAETISDTQSTDWMHIALTWHTGGGINIYINGILQPLAYETNAVINGSVNHTDDLYIGGTPGSSNYFTGLIDGVYIFKDALTMPQVTKLNFIAPTSNGSSPPSNGC